MNPARAATTDAARATVSSVRRRSPSQRRYEHDRPSARAAGAVRGYPDAVLPEGTGVFTSGIVATQVPATTHSTEWIPTSCILHLRHYSCEA